MADEPDLRKAQSPAEAARRERLAQALRDNLKRRKVQTRGRATGARAKQQPASAEE